MTASELIQQLSAFPPDTKIVVRGYEEGYNDILQLKPVRIKLDVGSHWYEGEYDDSPDADAIHAIDLFGENKTTKDD